MKNPALSFGACARAVMRIDAGGALSCGTAAEILDAMEDGGAVHIVNTGLDDYRSLLPLMEVLGFGEAEQYREGGRTCEAWQKKWVAPGLRRMDYYPPHLHLLASTEVQYRHDFPSRILFFCTQASVTGGRSFLHSAHEMVRVLESAPEGRALLGRILAHGLTIETGFLDQDHPEKAQNYYPSWQVCFGSKDPAEALKIAQVRTDEYDECWWHEEQNVLMTKITLPGFIADRNGNPCLRFPRIAMDGPTPKNGYRRFPFGNGEDFSADERAFLRNAYRMTEQSVLWQSGDILLFDNIRYGHSREPYRGERQLLVGMAGTERI